MDSADRAVAATSAPLIRRLGWQPGTDRGPDELVRREWLVTNGLGGYASGTIVGAITRRYHGLLVAALPAPLGRVMLLNHISERLRFEDYSTEWLGAYGHDGRLAQAEGTQHLVEFRLEAGLPVWRYALRDVVVERRLLMPYGQNSVHVTYRLVEGRQVDTARRSDPCWGSGRTTHPWIACRSRATRSPPAIAASRFRGTRPIHRFGSHSMRLRARSPWTTTRSRTFDTSSKNIAATSRRDRCGAQVTFAPSSRPDREVTLIASTESWETIAAINPVDALATERDRRTRLVAAAHPAARSGVAAELVLAADQFIIRPSSRTDDEARARASGGEARTVIAGYHWFTDWGRDTMISLEGLTLAHRPPRRGARHPPDICLPRPRRAHSQHVSRRRA